MSYPPYASPDSVPSPEGSQPVESSDEHLAAAHDPHASLLQLPWCQTCGPFIRMLFSYAREHAQLQGRTMESATGALPQSPFADYVVVTALVHRSQLASSEGYTSLDSSTHPSPAAVSSAGHTMREEQMTAPTTVPRKTRGVKAACTNCRRVSKRCDEGRPCMRCLSRGLADTCANASTKPRRRNMRHAAAATVAAASGSPGHSVSTPCRVEGMHRTPPPAAPGQRDPVPPETGRPWAPSAVGTAPADTCCDVLTQGDASDLLHRHLVFPETSRGDAQLGFNWVGQLGALPAQAPFVPPFDWDAAAFLMNDRAGPVDENEAAHARADHY
ncbi:hypothetical protein GY45DRAFT_148071 [Cubamyces sp. BRFM 1775]|nr:hypothetical protein GY45DRAFT_148071 [Cubamyces sp. BRFM 1775]